MLKDWWFALGFCFSYASFWVFFSSSLSLLLLLLTVINPCRSGGHTLVKFA